MATQRKFASFSKNVSGAQVPSFRMKEIPDGGICLSAFLVISKKDFRDEILMGHLNTLAPWDHIGALDSSRIEAHSKGWMLPSSHLIVHESPQQAANRIQREQLEINDTSAVSSDPIVVSEVYSPKRFPNLVNHWDIEFIFRGEYGELPKSGAWSDLRYVKVGNIPRREMARSHDDIVESAGFKFTDS